MESSAAAAVVSDDTAAEDQHNPTSDGVERKKKPKKRKRPKTDTTSTRTAAAAKTDDDNDDNAESKKKKKRKKEKKERKEEKKKLEPAAAAKKRDKKERKRKRKADKKKMKKRSNEEGHDKDQNNESSPSSLSAAAAAAATAAEAAANIDDHQPITKRLRISSANNDNNSDLPNPFPFDIRHVVAPMVGASELAFRLLARKYGATLAYTPMMSAAEFARSSAYRRAEFQTIPEDRPLVCHFASNNPAEFAAAAKLVEDRCDAVDLNLGCPQRTAYVGHFGSYLMDSKDRQLVLDIVRVASEAVKIPIFVKIRLLDTLDDTIELCRQLRQAGAALIAIHGRFRASFERKGPGARDGPAKLDQIAAVKQALGPNFPILSNGNVISYNDVLRNMEETGADGIMSAEGLLDNPAVFLERFGTRDGDGDNAVMVIQPSPLPGGNGGDASLASNEVNKKKKRRKFLKKLREIVRIEAKIEANGETSIDNSQQKKLATKTDVEKELAEIDTEEKYEDGEDDPSTNRSPPTTKSVPLKQLYDQSEDRIKLAYEYLGLARRYPVKIRSVIFHTRRMCRDLLNEYQLMEECVACKSIDEVEAVLAKLEQYRSNPDSFFYDRDKAKREKEALEKKGREEGKRKAYEARMVRKAKREGLDDLEFYLRQGAELPTVKIVQWLRTLPREEQLKEWKEREHSQHCLSYHLDAKGCKRDRACAFLHVEAKGDNTFVEQDEVAG